MRLVYSFTRIFGLILLTIGLDKIHEGLPFIFFGLTLFAHGCYESIKWSAAQEISRKDSPHDH